MSIIAYTVQLTGYINTVYIKILTWLKYEICLVRKHHLSFHTVTLRSPTLDSSRKKNLSAETNVFTRLSKSDSPLLNVCLEKGTVPSAVTGNDHESPRQEALPQLDEPALGLREAMKELDQDQVITFQLIRDPGHLGGGGSCASYVTACVIMCMLCDHKVWSCDHMDVVM